MADRANHPAVLTRRGAAIVLAIVIASLMSPRAASAHNQWEGAYRKWPWRAGATRTITTLPGECPHCPGIQTSSAWRAIDVNMKYETVYSIAPGVVELYDPNGGGAGRYLRVRDDDGTFIVYEHLDSAIVTSGSVVAGQPLAVSGCTGNCHGAHLHFQRQDGRSFWSNALDLVPISGHGESSDPLRRAEYDSDNAGIGYGAGGNVFARIQEAYERSGGYSGAGVTGMIGLPWSPCRAQRSASTWWRYACTYGDYTGSVQLFWKKGSRRALLHAKGAGEAFLLRQGILGAYTELWNGYDWLHWIGYPTSNRSVVRDDYYRQLFEDGYIDFRPSTCTAWVFSGSTLRKTYTFCD